MFPDIPADELAACLDRTARRLLRRAGVRRPPVDAIRIAATLGIQTATDGDQQSRARYIELRSARGGAPKPAILLRPEPRPERRQWAVAHELGEREAGGVFRRLSIDPRTAPATARESVANHLAGRILLPSKWFARAGMACGWDLLALKTRFETASHELILRRMLDFPPPILVTIFDNARCTFRRGNVAGRLQLTDMERACWQAVRETCQSQERFSSVCHVRGWAVHEEGWKRELLRLELLEDFEDSSVHGDDVWPDDVEVKHFAGDEFGEPG